MDSEERKFVDLIIHHDNIPPISEADFPLATSKASMEKFHGKLVRDELHFPRNFSVYSITLSKYWKFTIDPSLLSQIRKISKKIIYNTYSKIFEMKIDDFIKLSPQAIDQIVTLIKRTKSQLVKFKIDFDFDGGNQQPESINSRRKKNERVKFLTSSFLTQRLRGCIPLGRLIRQCPGLIIEGTARYQILPSGRLNLREYFWPCLSKGISSAKLNLDDHTPITLANLRKIGSMIRYNPLKDLEINFDYC
jgi:hypothetical protein